jgi:sugar phosphate isomerase/epimerase
LSSTEDCQFILDQVPGLGLVFDTANMKPVGDDEIDFYNRLHAYIRHVHVKDVAIGESKYGDRMKDGTQMNVVISGTGIVKIKELVEMMNRDGFLGTATIEYAHPSKFFCGVKPHAESMKKYVEYLRNYL